MDKYSRETGSKLFSNEQQENPHQYYIGVFSAHLFDTFYGRKGIEFIPDNRYDNDSVFLQNKVLEYVIEFTNNEHLKDRPFFNKRKIYFMKLDRKLHGELDSYENDIWRYSRGRSGAFHIGLNEDSKLASLTDIKDIYHYLCELGDKEAFDIDNHEEW